MFNYSCPQFPPITLGRARGELGGFEGSKVRPVKSKRKGRLKTPKHKAEAGYKPQGMELRV